MICDVCGFHAIVEVRHPVLDLVLTFCGHHYAAVAPLPSPWELAHLELLDSKLHPAFVEAP